MRLPRTEVERRRQAVLAFFRKNPTMSVAKMNAALKAGELTGHPEKMLNIATGYTWRKEAIATPELPLNERLDAQGVPESPLIGGTPAATCPGDGCKGCASCLPLNELSGQPTNPDDLPATLDEHTASIEKM